jgi:myo-inositol 2-dehydrogenase/D-chiro-inositol 1-dehydrogenase
MLRFCLIGVGRIGRLHAQNVALADEATIVAVVDPDLKAATGVAEKFGARVFTDAAEAIQTVPVDAVLICSPTDTHVAMIEVAAAARLPIFCEKPVDLNIDRVIRAMQAVESAGVFFTIGFHRRFDPAHREAYEARVKGRIGRMEQMTLIARDPSPPPPEYVRRSGGIFRDMMIHDIDQARYLAGEEFVGVIARGSCMIDPKFEELNDYDTATALFWTASGLTCTIQNSRRSIYGFDQRAELFGERGVIRVENPRQTTLAIEDSAGVHGSSLHHFFPPRYKDAYRNELQHFIASITNGLPPEPNINDGYRSMVMANGATTSAREGRAVTLVYDHEAAVPVLSGHAGDRDSRPR